jgi:NAD(P)-dependent dehydrogenase (short-subunit alcohol dehydrogenase family)
MMQNGKNYNQWAAYGQAKTANMLFSLSLADRLKNKRISSFSLHPGGTRPMLGSKVELLTNL